MAKLIYLTTASLDGYVADEDGSFDWTEPDEEVHAFVNDLVRSVGTFLFGRRMYEVMAVWETLPLAGESPAMREFADVWKAADKVVYSKTLESPSSARTTIERDFDPEEVCRMKAKAEREIGIGGSELAGEAMRANLVDDLHLFLVPVVIGGGTRFLPHHVRVPLELVDQRPFEGGTVYLHHRVLT